MAGIFDSLILTDSVTTALESRAHREGILESEDYRFSDFAKPTPRYFGVREQIALDYVCLYNNVVSTQKNFDLSPINELAGQGIIHFRPNLIRSIDLQIRSPNIGLFEIDISDDEYLDLLELASNEARFVLKSNLRNYIADCRTSYESEVRKQSWEPVIGDEFEISDSQSFWVIRNNISWLIELFEASFWHGCDSATLEAHDLVKAKTARHNIVLVDKCLRSERFTSYFYALQEIYFNLFENSFLGRFDGLELAYDTTPAQRASQHPVGEVTKAIRVNLGDIVDYFPLPRTLEEALEFRGHPRVVAFREAIERWLPSLKNGASVEQKLRRELEAANRDLQRLKSWRHIKSQPWFFGLRTAAGLVPGIGAIASIVDTIDYFAERRVTRRTGWVVAQSNRLGECTA